MDTMGQGARTLRRYTDTKFCFAFRWKGPWDGQAEGGFGTARHGMARNCTGCVVSKIRLKDKEWSGPRRVLPVVQMPIRDY